MSDAAQTNQLVLTFEAERETKGTRRFAEQVKDGDEPVVGTLYVRKQALARLGNPDALTVTIGPIGKA